MHEENSKYPQNILTLAQNLKHLGRMLPVRSKSPKATAMPMAGTSNGVNDPIIAPVLKAPVVRRWNFILLSRTE